MRILLACLNSLGGVLAASPVPQVLKEHHPDAEITWLVEPALAPVVGAIPAVDEVIVVDRLAAWQAQLRGDHFLTLGRELRAFSRTLTARRFDIALDLHGTFASRALLRLSGARRRIGFQPTRLRERLFLTEFVEHGLPTTRYTQRSLALLRALDITPLPQRPVLQVPDADREAAQDLLTEAGIFGSYAACVVAGSHTERQWVWSRWGELADALWAREGLRTVFIGGPERRCDTLQLMDSCASEPISLVGRTSLLQAIALVQDARLVIGGDTGLTCAGLATETPSVVLYGSTDPTRLAEEPAAAVCFHPYPCAPCHGFPTCKHTDCLASLSVGEVLDAAMMLLQQMKVFA